jgi:hydroxyacylglutathione hydrolase
METLMRTFNFQLQIKTGIIMLHIKSFTFSPIQENTYVLYNDAGDACIIDPGCYHKREENELAEFIERKKLVPRLLLNTHCHLDHVFGLAWAAEHYQLVPHIHRNELQMLELAPMNGDMWGIPFKGYKGPLEYLTEGQVISRGTDELKVLYAPGHSPGHVCFYAEKQDFVIGGDVLFKNSVGRTDLPGGNHKVLIESIRTQLLTLPGETIVYSGHGPATTVGEEKDHNPFLGDFDY